MERTEHPIVATFHDKSDNTVMTVCLDWTIENFSFLRSKTTFLFSRGISMQTALGVDGIQARWILMVKPCHILVAGDKGIDKNRRKSISVPRKVPPRAAVYVSLLDSDDPGDDYSGTSEFPAEITFKVLNRDGQSAYVVGEENLGRTFSAQSATWGFEANGIPHSRLFGSARQCLLVDDALILRCTIRFLVECQPTTLSTTQHFPSHDSVNTSHYREAALQRYRNLYRSREHTDFTLISNDGHEFPVHRGILSAQSPMFALIFDEEENENGTREMADLTKEILGAMLEYMYYCGTERTGPLAEELLVVAENYEIDDLKDICEDHLVSGVTVRNAARLLVLAEQHSLEKLEKACVEFIVSDGDFVLEEEGNEKLVSTALVQKIVQHCSQASRSHSQGKHSDDGEESPTSRE